MEAEADAVEDNGRRWYHFAFGNPNSSISIIFAAFHVPFTSTIAFVTLGVYLFLRHEYLVNPWLRDSTPPPLDQHLPTYEEWTADGGLKKVTDAESREDEDCLICRDVLREPTQITACKHMFCSDCLAQWYGRGHRSCPQCTTTLFRSPPTDRSRLERLAKFTTAQALVGILVTAYAIYICFTSYMLNSSWRQTARWNTISLVFYFTVMCAGVLVLLGLGLGFVWQRRQVDGTRWWGGNVENEDEEPWSMAMLGFAFVEAWWLLCVSLVVEGQWGTLVLRAEVRYLLKGLLGLVKKIVTKLSV